MSKLWTLDGGISVKFHQLEQTYHFGAGILIVERRLCMCGGRRYMGTLPNFFVNLKKNLFKKDKIFERNNCR